MGSRIRLRGRRMKAVPVSAQDFIAGRALEALRMTDDGYLLLAIADDFRAEHPDDEPIDPDEVYDWLVAQAHKVDAL